MRIWILALGVMGFLSLGSSQPLVWGQQDLGVASVESAGGQEIDFAGMWDLWERQTTQTVIVKYRDDLVPDAVDAKGPLKAVRGQAAPAVERVRFRPRSGLHVYAVPAGMSCEDLVAAFEKDPRVLYCEENGSVRGSEIPNDPFYQNFLGNPGDLQRWAFNGTGFSGRGVDAERGWSIQTGRQDVVIAIVDSGFDFPVNSDEITPWVNGGEIPGNGIDDDNNGFIDDVLGWDFVGNDNDPLPPIGNGIDDDQDGTIDLGVGHGTSVASVAGARGGNGFLIAGASWNCTLMNVRVLNEENTGTLDDLVEGIFYAADNGADVINMSFETSVFSLALQDAVNYAFFQKKAVLVAAAGNSSTNSSVWPAQFTNVIGVGASDSGSIAAGGSGDVDGRAVFSNFGPLVVDVVAPGAGVLALGKISFGQPDAGNLSVIAINGTSFATPMVSGQAALMISEARDNGSEIDNFIVLGIIQATAVDLPDDPDDPQDETWDDNGMVNFFGSLQLVRFLTSFGF